MQRVGLSRAEKLAALDQLAELTQAIGLRHTARQLQIDPGWLSRQLAVRRDPTIYAALEAGQLGFGQAAELLRAPRQARLDLLKRVVNEPQSVRTSTIRAWVEDARFATRADAHERPREVMHAEASRAKRGGHYSTVLAELERLGPPRSADDRLALFEVFKLAQQLLKPTPIAKSRPLPTTRQDWVELNCLMCGEPAAVIENGAIHARSDKSLRQSGTRLVCGRCGGALARGDRGVSYVHATPAAS
jgi:hypothetical protein